MSSLEKRLSAFGILEGGYLEAIYLLGLLAVYLLLQLVVLPKLGIGT